MKFLEFVSIKGIRPELQALDKDSVINEMVEALVDANEIKADDRESITAAVLKREDLGSTGIGKGIAVPHTKHPNV